MESALNIVQPATPGRATEGGRLYTHYVLAILTLVSLSNYLDRMILAVLLDPIKQELGLHDWQLGMLTGFAFAAFYASFGLPIARLADRSRRTVVLGVALGVWSIMTALCGAAQNFVQLLLARFGVGAGEAGCVPTGHSLIADYYPREERAPAISIFQTGGALGSMLGIMLAGMLAERIGWRMTFVALGLPGLLLMLVVFLTVREPPRGRFETSPAPPPTKGSITVYRELLRQKTYRNLVIGFALGMFAAYGVMQWSPSFFLRSHGMTLTDVGFWYGLTSGTGGVAGVLAGGFLARPLIRRDRRWEAWFPGWSYLCATPIYVALFAVPSLDLALVLTLVGSFISALGLGPGLASLQSVTTADRRATAVALVMFASAIFGLGGGPFLVGLLSDLTFPTFGANSLRLALVCSTLMLVWAAFHFFRAARSFRDDIVR